MVSKFGKEKSLFKNDSFRVKYGTIDAVKLNSVYIEIQSWIQPLEMINFESNVRLSRKNLILKIKETLDKNLFNENFIVDLDLRPSGMNLNKKSFMSIEVTIFPEKKLKFNSDVLKNEIRKIASTTIETIQKNNFNFYSKK